MDIRDHSKKLLPGENEDDSIPGMPWTLKEVRESLDKRSSIIDNVESRLDTVKKQKEEELRDALDADFGDKLSHYRRAEELRIMQDNLDELLDKFQVEQIFLTKIVSHATRNAVIENAEEEFGLEVKISEIDPEQVASALEEQDSQGDEAMEVVEKTDEILEQHSSGSTDNPLDLSDVKEEARGLTESEVEERVKESEERSEVEDALDENIEERLSELEDDPDDQ